MPVRPLPSRSRRRRAGRHRLLTLITTLFVVTATAVIGAPAAHADDYGCCLDPSLRDGDLVIYINGGMGACGYANSSPTLGRCANKDEVIDNRGYQNYGAARLYWGTYYTGAYFCLGNLYHWAYSTTYGRAIRFNRGGSGASGYGERIAHNVASIKWVQSC